MSLASVTSTRRTVWPLMSMPRIAAAFCSASAGSAASRTPPALPRPPVLTWALTTTAVPSRSATARACSAVSATSPGRTGTPCAANSSLAWYSLRSTAAAYRAPRGVRSATIRRAARSGGGHGQGGGPGASATGVGDRLQAPVGLPDLVRDRAPIQQDLVDARAQRHGRAEAEPDGETDPDCGGVRVPAAGGTDVDEA